MITFKKYPDATDEADVCTFNSEQEIENVVNELDEIIRDESGKITKVTKNANDPNYKGILVPWFRIEESNGCP